jgi:alpha-tubulin suppressor-like RCC1 family protein
MGRQGAPNLVVPSFCFDQNSGALLPERKCDPSRWVLADPQALLFNSDYLLPPSPAIVAVAAGAYHTVAITADAKMLAWGWNGYGQLGSPTNMPTYGLPAHPADKTQRNLPTPTEFVEPAAQTAVFTQVGPAR